MPELTEEERKKIYEEEKLKYDIKEKPKVSKTKGRLSFVCATVLLVAALSMCSSPDKKDASTNSNPSTPSVPTSTVQEKTDLELLESSAKKEPYGTSIIIGTIKNNSNKTYKYAQVEINLYDASDTQIGSTLANVNNLEPGATWKFKAPVIEENFAKWKIKDITGW
jgi:hypothetical protein